MYTFTCGCTKYSLTHYKYTIHIQRTMKLNHESTPQFFINGKRRSQFNDSDFDFT